MLSKHEYDAPLLKVLHEEVVLPEYHYIAKALKPPSTTATVPVTKRAASDMR